MWERSRGNAVNVISRCERSLTARNGRNRCPGSFGRTAGDPIGIGPQHHLVRAWQGAPAGWGIHMRCDYWTIMMSRQKIGAIAAGDAPAWAR